MILKSYTSAKNAATNRRRLERRRPVRDEGRADFLDAVGKGELELGNQKLLDVGTANVVGLLDLHDTENLIESKVRIPLPQSSPLRA